MVGACHASFHGKESGKLIHRGTIDWARFLRLVRFHRVQGLVWDGLGDARASLPPDAREALAHDARGIAEANLRAAAECARLRAEFARAGLALLFVKGLSLAQLAYRTIATKAATDIDMLIARGDLVAGADLLRAMGYRTVIPEGPVTAKQLSKWHRLRKESAWVAKDGVCVDLHTALADHPSLIPSIGIASERQMVTVSPDIVLPTLNDDEQFAYLCVHGASSAWFRLKWAVDVAAFLHGRPASEIDRLYRRAVALGAGRTPALALMIVDRLFGTLEGLEQLRAELRHDRVARRITDAVMARLDSRRGPVEPTSRPLGTLFIHVHQFALDRGWRFKLTEFVRQARTTLR